MSEWVKVISETKIKEVLTPEDAIDQVEKTWKWYGMGDVIMPTKITLDMESIGVPGWMNSMPSYIKATDKAGMKWVGGFKENPKQGKPFIRAKVFLADPRTGDLLAVVAGDWISDMRTGAQPAIMAKYLASKTDVVTIIGAGIQGYTTLLCMSKLLKMKEVRICDICPEARQKMIERFADAPFKMVDCDNNEAACQESDIIITVTTANAVLVEEPWVKKGAIVITMGSFSEISEDLIRKADMRIVDHIGQALHRGSFAEMAARGEITEESFATDMPTLVSGKHPGRTNPEDRIIVSPIGMGAPDAALAALALERIEAAGIEVPMVDLT
ncbi:MAG: ornithine cyclodeaminase family protein [Planctomycetia bacterium]|nr:ornithine cyclodeaminase family protein [Planctomycetia bacterium]